LYPVFVIEDEWNSARAAISFAYIELLI